MMRLPNQSAGIGPMALRRGRGRGRDLGYECSEFECECHGDIDCNEMFDDLWCIDEWCTGSGAGTYCYCYGPMERFAPIQGIRLR